MFQPLSLFIGLRYTRARRRNQFISLVSMVSLLGMILGIVALVVVMSVMNGFEAELRNRVLAVVPHAFLTGPDRRLPAWQQYTDPLLELPFVEGVAPYIDGNVMLERPGMVRPAQLNAIDPALERQVSQIGERMIDGDYSALRPGEYKLLIGEILARFMGLYVGDEVSVILPQVTVTPVGIFPRVKRFTIAGIFQVGAELDSNTVFIHLADGQRLFQYGSAVKGLRVKVDDLLRVQDYQAPMQAVLPAGGTVTSWVKSQGSLFAAVAMEKMMVALLLLIIVAIAAFNIISILTMMVAEKRSDIAVLRTMGASASAVQRVFMIQGLTVGVSGVLIGLLLGVPIAYNAGGIVAWFESLFGGAVFNPNVYFISRIPSVVRWQDILLVASCGTLLSFLATLYPSLRAANIHPAEALRYE